MSLGRMLTKVVLGVAVAKGMQAVTKSGGLCKLTGQRPESAGTGTRIDTQAGGSATGGLGGGLSDIMGSLGAGGAGGGTLGGLGGLLGGLADPDGNHWRGRNASGYGICPRRNGRAGQCPSAGR